MADPVIGDDRAPVSPAEFQAGLLAPIHVYALFESVLARRAGRTYAEHRAALGQFMAPFTEVAATHGYAWFPEVRTPAELATVSPHNRLIAEPYVKNMCAMFSVDQGAAVIVTSLGAARRAGVDEGAVFCWSGAECRDVWFPAARPDPGSAPGMAAAIGAALTAAGTGTDELDAFDLYSCFPCAVELAAGALGMAPDDRRRLTVTGGLPYFGGPGNNYSLHAVATMAERLRQEGGTGLVTALGWYLTKHAVGVYGSAPPPRGWRHGDTAERQAAIDATAVPIAQDGSGPALVVASTVALGHGGEVTAAPVIARLDDGRHVAAAADPSELPSLAGRNLVGTTIEVEGAPVRYRVSG
jgi:acetyl-CoA C-acetyltransferase